VTDSGLLARSRTLAKLALVSAAALVVLVLLLVLLVDHTTVSEVFLLVWGLFLLLAAIILGVALAYVFMTRGAYERHESVAPAPASRDRIEETATAPVDILEGAVPEVALRLLSGDELGLYRRIVAAGGSVLQKDLVGLGLFSGPKVSRILERLEAKGLIVRERHGMTNRIRLSDAWRERA